MSLPSLMDFCPLFHQAFDPFTIRLSSYSHGLSLECTQKFSTLCLKHGLTKYSSSFGLFLFIYHFFFSFFEKGPLARIYCSIPFKIHEVLIILGLGMQQGGPILGSFILGFKGCWMLSSQRTCYLRPKVLFFQMAFSTWAYDSNQAMVL